MKREEEEERGRTETQRVFIRARGGSSIRRTRAGGDGGRGWVGHWGHPEPFLNPHPRHPSGALQSQPPNSARLQLSGRQFAPISDSTPLWVGRRKVKGGRTAGDWPSPRNPLHSHGLPRTVASVPDTCSETSCSGDSLQPPNGAQEGARASIRSPRVRRWGTSAQFPFSAVSRRAGDYLLLYCIPIPLGRHDSAASSAFFFFSHAVTPISQSPYFFPAVAANDTVISHTMRRLGGWENMGVVDE